MRSPNPSPLTNDSEELASHPDGPLAYPPGKSAEESLTPPCRGIPAALLSGEPPKKAETRRVNASPGECDVGPERPVQKRSYAPGGELSANGPAQRAVLATLPYSLLAGGPAGWSPSRATPKVLVWRDSLPPILTKGPARDPHAERAPPPALSTPHSPEGSALTGGAEAP